MQTMSAIFFGLLPLAVTAAPTLVWHAPSPMDDRISHYEIHCAGTSLPPVADEVNRIARVDVSETSVLITDQLLAGEKYECVAYSWSDAYSLRSAPSNAITLDYTNLVAPTGLRIGISIDISSD